MITITDQNNKLNEVEVINFSDGTINVRIPLHITYVKCVSWIVENAVIEMEVLRLTINALGHHLGSGWSTNLYLPYVPNARADRVFLEGNAFPLESFVHQLARLPFTKVMVSDPHSEVFIRLCRQYSLPLEISSQAYLASENYGWCIRGTTIVSPDKGAAEKSAQLALHLSTDVIQASKVRDLDTGRIISVSLPDIVYSGRKFTICDDICDGGGTFLPIAETLKNNGASEVNLYVTHGIFSKGLKLFEKHVDNIYTSGIVGSFVTNHDIQKFNMRKGK